MESDSGDWRKQVIRQFQVTEDIDRIPRELVGHYHALSLLYINSLSKDRGSEAREDPETSSHEGDKNLTQLALKYGTLKDEHKFVSEQNSVLRDQAEKSSNDLKALQKQVSQNKVELEVASHLVKEKDKMIQTLQDEMLTLQLSLNMSEEKAEKLRRENHDLVNRWMQKMKQEAERMNLANDL